MRRMRSSSLGLVATLALCCAPVQPPAAAPAAASRASCAAAAICDDFEAYPPGQPPGGPWALLASAGETAAVDGGKSWSGKRTGLGQDSRAGHHAWYTTLA